jgi:filamentous hemagglutinin family protein
MDESTARSRHPDSLGQALLSALLPILALFLITPSVGDAQVPVVTDITSTPGAGDLGTIVTPNGNLYDITGGTRPGGGPNLFHSFGDFTVGSGDIANFLNDSGLMTSNIIGRVTGGNVSNIDGTIRTNGFDVDGVLANLFLVNPAGILFGPQGSFDVGGSVSFSTAQYLRLFDSLNGGSANFYADSANDPLTNSVFAMAPIVDFGFLSPAGYGFLTAPAPTATITVQGSELSVPPGPPDSPGHSISLVGGNVIIQGEARLSAPRGNILLATAATPGEFDVNTLQSLPNNPVDPASAVSFTSFGTVSLLPGSSIDVSGANTVFVNNGQLVLSVNNATLTTTESAAPQDTDTVSLSLGSSITTSNSGADPGVDVQITVGNLQMDGASLSTINSSDRDGGNISINATAADLTNGASVLSLSFTGFDSTTFLPMVTGSGGNITADVGTLALTNGATILSLNTSFSGGLDQHGGNVTIQGLHGSGSAAGNVHLDGSFIITKTSGTGHGGDVHVTADSLTLENSSQIFTVARDFTVNSVLPVKGGDLFLNVGTLNLLGGPFGGSQIGSISSGSDLDGDEVVDVRGMGGNINITVEGTTPGAGSMLLSGGSAITSDASAESGSGGQISIKATSLDLDGASTIKSSTAATKIDLNGDGVVDTEEALAARGGDIVVAVQDLHVLQDATISSSTSSENLNPAAGGTVTVQGLDGSGSMASSVLLSGLNTGIVSDSIQGLSGDITVQAGNLTITDGAQLSIGSPLSGLTGLVTVTADSVLISAGGRIFSQSFAEDAGNVTITANNALTLDNGSIVTSTTSESLGGGGDVVVNGGTVNLTNGASINSQSEIFSNGRAGDITMNVASLTLANQSEVTSSSKGILVGAAGDAGNITIQSGSTVQLNNSSITTEARAASGGQITINASEMIRLTNSQVSTSVAGSDVDTAGGNISIDPPFMIMQNSQIIAQAFAGSGGAINIIAGAFLADPNSLVDASSTLGVSGTVNIQSPVQNIGEELTALTEEFASAAALLAQQCAARVADGKFSTFVVAAREGLPMEPGGFLASPSLTAELLGARLSGRNLQSQLSAVTSLFPTYDARPIQLAKLGNACHQ